MWIQIMLVIWLRKDLGLLVLSSILTMLLFIGHLRNREALKRVLLLEVNLSQWRTVANIYEDCDTSYRWWASHVISLLTSLATTSGNLNFSFKSHFLLYCYHIQFSIAQYKVDCSIHFSISESILDIFFSVSHLHSKFSFHAPIIYPNNLLRQFNQYPIKPIFIDFTYLNIMTSNPHFQIIFSFL